MVIGRIVEKSSGLGIIAMSLKFMVLLFRIEFLLTGFFVGIQLHICMMSWLLTLISLHSPDSKHFSTLLDGG